MRKYNSDQLNYLYILEGEINKLQMQQLVSELFPKWVE